MNIYPAIDLYEGKVIRLKRGNYHEKTIYSNHPSSTAQEWEAQGAQWLHVVDLEGAKTGVIKNQAALSKIRKSVACRIQFGGGVRRLEDIKSLLDLGVDRVILGTKALDKTFFDAALGHFPHQAAVGLDIKQGIVQTQGWLQSENQTLLGAMVHFNHYPLETIIYTDIQKDGMLEGPNFVTLKDILKISKAKVILSGGISGLADIEKCAKMATKNFEGIIVGKALYERKFLLQDALKLLGTDRQRMRSG